MKKRLLAIGIVIVIISLVIINVLQIHKAGDIVVETTNLSKEMLTETIISQGKLKLATQQAFYFQSEKGELAEFFIKEGDTVKKGTKLFSYKNKQLLREQEANDLQLRSNYLELNNFKKQHRDIDKELETVNNDEQLKKEHDQIELQHQQAEIELENTILEKKSIQQQIDELIVKSNINGTVVTINKEAALDSEQSQQHPIVQVASLNKFIVTTDVSEYDILKINEGQPVILTTDVLHDKSWKGNVGHVSYLPKKLESTDVSGDMGAKYPIEVVIEDENIDLNPGVQMLVEIKTNKKKVKTLPLTAVKQKDSKNFVYVVNEGKVEKRIIKVGIVSEDKIEIKDGLSNKDNVIVDFSEGVKEGMEVTVK